MFRQRGSSYGRQARRRRARAWGTGAVVIAGCGGAVLAVHLATAPTNLSAVNSSYSHAFHAFGGQGSHSGYGRGGYTMMPHPSEATAATSTNWAGYVAAGNAGTFTSVSTSWTQPTVTCDAADTFSLTHRCALEGRSGALHRFGVRAQRECHLCGQQAHLRARKQHHTQSRFEGCDVPSQRGLGHAQRAGRAG